jgi:hypothetical protein
VLFVLFVLFVMFVMFDIAAGPMQDPLRARASD